MGQEGFDYYLRLREQMLMLLPVPHVVLYLDVPAEECYTRIHNLRKRVRLRLPFPPFLPCLPLFPVPLLPSLQLPLNFPFFLKLFTTLGVVLAHHTLCSQSISSASRAIPCVMPCILLLAVTRTAKRDFHWHTLKVWTCAMVTSCER